MGINDASNEELIIDQFKKGNESAFDKVFNLYFKALRNFANKIIKNEEAEDIVLVAFGKLWQKHESFDQLINIKAYLFITVRNSCLQYLRAQKMAIIKNSEFQDELIIAEENSVDKEAVRGAVLSDIYNEIENLPKQRKKILKLAFEDGLKTGEIAKLLNIQPQTVTDQRRKGLNTLREIFNNKKLILLIQLINNLLSNIKKYKLIFQLTA
jgi:RNA polymerase sigma-70 factor (ECF subfamily)